MNRLSLLILLLTSTLPLPASAASLTIDLDKPGALEAVQAERPAEYRKVIAILRDAERLPQSEVAGWVHTAYQAESVQFSQMLLVSLPPKRRLSFSLDEASYTATVTVSTSPTRKSAE